MRFIISAVILSVLLGRCFILTKIKLKNIYFGKEEAEAECGARSQIKLGEVFADYLDVIQKLENDEYFIVIGRKGTGKSAIAKYYCSEYFN